MANMLYLNFGRSEGKWIPNRYGDTGSLEVVEFLKNLNGHQEIRACGRDPSKSTMCVDQMQKQTR